MVRSSVTDECCGSSGGLVGGSGGLGWGLGAEQILWPALRERRKGKGNDEGEGEVFGTKPSGVRRLFAERRLASWPNRHHRQCACDAPDLHERDLVGYETAAGAMHVYMRWGPSALEIRLIYTRKTCGW